METLGERLKKIRTDKKLTQIAFGNILGVTKQAIANIESSHSNPSIDFLSKLIENLGVNANWLITGKGDIYHNYTKSNQISDSLPDDEFVFKVKKILKQEGLIN